MNEEKKDVAKKKEFIKNSIENIKIHTLRDELLRKFELESILDKRFESLPMNVANKSLNLLEEKVKFCQQIEKDLPDDLLSPGDYHLLLGKLDVLRLKLAILYVGEKQSEIEENYNGIKNFILKILSLNLNFKLKCFDLVIKLLDKVKDLEFNKEFIASFDFLKLFVIENHHPNQVNLQYINNLGQETNEEDIRKLFYGIIYELDEKLLFQALLSQLLEILKKHNNLPLKIIENPNKLPLVQFNIKLIKKCLVDPEMDAADFYQLIDIICETLKRDEERIKAKTRSEKIINPENSVDLSEFKKDLEEKISRKIIDNLQHSSQEKKPYFVVDILNGLDFITYFPTHIYNEKIKAKLSETKVDYNKILEKKLISHDRFFFKSFKDRLVKISGKANEIMESAKNFVLDTKENLEEFAETNADRLTEFLKKKSETSYPEENEKINRKDMKPSLKQAKILLLTIKDKLEVWNSILLPNGEENYENIPNQIDTNLVDLNQCLELLDRYSDSINEKFAQLIQQVIDELEKTLNAIKEKKLWFSISELNKSSVFHRIFRRGYFNHNFTIKKIKAHLNNDLHFNKVNSFMLNQSFWSLLSFGVLRWPWMNKEVFASIWAEQLCFPDTVSRIEELKEVFLLGQDKEKILKELISISRFFLPDKNEISPILESLKKYIIITLEQLKIVDQKINDCNEKENSLSTASSSRTGFFSRNENCGFPAVDTYNSHLLGVTLKAH